MMLVTGPHYSVKCAVCLIDLHIKCYVITGDVLNKTIIEITLDWMDLSNLVTLTSHLLDCV